METKAVNGKVEFGAKAIQTPAKPRKMETGSAPRPGGAGSHTEPELEGKERKVLSS